MTSYLRLRNGHYYLRLRVPTDLRNKIPSKEFLKSLKTKDRKTARTSAAYLHSNLLEVLALLRSGFISGSQALERLDTLLQSKRSESIIIRQMDTEKPTQQPKHTLSQVILECTHDKQSGWTAKTQLEYGG